MSIVQTLHKANMICMGAAALVCGALSFSEHPEMQRLDPVVVEYLPPMPAALDEPAPDFEAALARLLGHEGGYASHRADPGGPTRYGMTQARARAEGYTGPMSAMPLSVARSYYRKVWVANGLDSLDAELASQSLDALVAHGPRAARWIHPDSARACQRLNQSRLRAYQGSKNWPTFGKGWEKRIKKNLETC